MKKISFDEILNIYEYEKVREERKREIIELKKNRRVFLGDLVHLVFENRQTVWFQIQEMIRAERMVKDEEIMQEIEVYNELVPDKNQLSVTMFIEIPDEEERKRLLPKLVGIHDHLYLHIGNKHTVRAIADERSKEDYEYGKAAVVHFLKFNLTDQQVEDLKNLPLKLEINHPNYKTMADIPENVKAELIKDLES
ncbi:conserved hypothetical protein [Hydrogenobacter thermophilus TK-6]|uniref:DUF3501 domain-containing protein n=1 Tax=Hydrogenobacter thermophilus (strain DSM 6534 / IAM 12695 / TK-6) TaxID=608538 RepID=D3DIM3_HYDTT|nr:DUF3501 family protein [Hydrogenobacter thermophilus]ADO45601.1 conserved hypothetical protein [Hydrogenobacter thermophilus TK-6]BAI69675.1 hypothetical protein HTH_1221 [Hydrogenobacter thermophilus TK-6]